MDLDVAQVRAFVTAADHGNVGRAAGELGVTQQAVSKRIARLEAAVGALFERTPAGVTLTDRGRRFLPAAQRMLAAADDALAVARDEPAVPLRVDVWGHLQAPLALVRSFTAAHRGTLVEVSMRRALPAAVQALARHELDVAFGNLATLEHDLPPHLTAVLVTTEPLALLVNARGPLAGTVPVGPDELRAHGLWWPLQATSPELAAFVVAFCRAFEVPVDPDGPNLGLDGLVDGVAADPERVTFVGAGWPVPTGRGVRTVPTTPVPHYPWWAIWRRDDRRPALQTLIRHVRSHGQVPSPGPDIWLPHRRPSRHEG